MDHGAETRLAALRTQFAQTEREEEDLHRSLEQVRATKGRIAAAIHDTERALEGVKLGRGAAADTTVRRIARELGTFTVSEFAAELDCSKPTAKRRIDGLVAEEILKPAGRFSGSPVFEYVKPTEAGVAFEQQQRLGRPVIKLPEPERLGERPRDIKQSSIGGIRDKLIKEVAREAIANGWELVDKGTSGHHHRLVRDTDWVELPSTPRNPGDTADRLRRRLGLKLKKREAIAS